MILSMTKLSGIGLILNLKYSPIKEFLTFLITAVTANNTAVTEVVTAITANNNASF